MASFPRSGHCSQNEKKVFSVTKRTGLFIQTNSPTSAQNIYTVISCKRKYLSDKYKQENIILFATVRESVHSQLDDLDQVFKLLIFTSVNDFKVKP